MFVHSLSNSRIGENMHKFLNSEPFLEQAEKDREFRALINQSLFSHRSAEGIRKQVEIGKDFDAYNPASR